MARTLTSGWIAHFGVPATIITDRGHQFESCLWTQLLQLFGCKHLRTTAYHPIANGIIEHFHRQLKVALRAHTPSEHWMERLRTSKQCSAKEPVYGTRLRLPGEVFHHNKADTEEPTTRLRKAMQELRAVPVREQSQRTNYISKRLNSCTRVCT